ncbi:MAG TPA: G1 family glutamic endopeptidase [Nocardioidaceae bacterium]|jgi:hypothetical protein|nr:G1 family glutamic endopeptidase [Nocardioidaceae bacterium]
MNRFTAALASAMTAVALAPGAAASTHLTRAVSGPAVDRSALSVSHNWSGEQLTSRSPGTFQGVYGTWHVPRVRATVRDKYSSTWVGVDGSNNRHLIQTGTEGDSVHGRTVYYAWWEILPRTETLIRYTNGQPVQVRPGDAIKATVVKTSRPNVWKISLVDSTEGWRFQTTRRYSGPGTSAEWIQEATTHSGAVSPVPAFTPVTFARLAVAESGRWYWTALTKANAVALVQHRRLKAFPARLTSGTPQRFTVYYKR